MSWLKVLGHLVSAVGTATFSEDYDAPRQKIKARNKRNKKKQCCNKPSVHSVSEKGGDDDSD